MKSCCTEMDQYLKAFENMSLPIGEGEISGSVVVDRDGIIISDGWSFLPYLPFRFCPFCGNKREVGAVCDSRDV